MSNGNFEEMFLSILNNASRDYVPYLQMFNNNGFSYCIKEIKHYLNNEITGKGGNNNSIHLINNFYNFILQDKVFCQIDELAYRNTVLKLKEFSEGDNTSKKEKYAFFESLDRRYIKNYFKKTYEIIIDMCEKHEQNLDKCYYYSTVFISELLSSGLNYLFLGYIANKYHQGKFNSFIEFINYLYSGREDSYDIYLPLKDVDSRNIMYFEKHNQKIEIIENCYYCKIYQNNCIDLFFVIRQNIMRIESIFNILRLYSDAKIDFDYSKDVIIKSKYFNECEHKEFDVFIKYKGIKPYYKHIENTVDNFFKLKDEDSLLYHKLLNTISYAKKDKDVVEQRSFVNNWIALESLCSLSERRIGFDAVYYIVPKALAAKIISNDITFLLRNALHGKNATKLENFLDKLWNDEIDLSVINNVYYYYRLSEYCKILKDLKKLETLFQKIEAQVEIDLIRIYLLRNEYVHESKLQAFSSMQYYCLKNILQMMLDEFFKNLNTRIDKDNTFGYGFESFNLIIEKYELRNTAFRVINDKKLLIKRADLNLHMEMDSVEIKEAALELNILKSNIGLFKVYVPSDEYEKNNRTLT